MIVVQAAPKTQPGGVHGALDKFKYQSDIGPLSISQLPKANPPKLMNRNNIKDIIFLLITFFLIIQFSLISDLLQHIFDH